MLSKELRQLVGWVRSAGRVTVLTGAGVSTDSGIPDYRGPDGVWTRDPEAQLRHTLNTYTTDPEVRRQAWRHRLAHPVWSAQPNAAHLALVELERAGRLDRLVTQNIDGLHQRAGSSPDKVVEVHGTALWARCTSCLRETPMPEQLARVAAGEEDPACAACGGIQTSATVAFGQPLDVEVLKLAVEAAERCEVFIAIGTSLTVHPAAGLCGVAREGGARLAIVNAQDTPYDAVADAVVRDPVGTAVPALVSDLGLG